MYVDRISGMFSAFNFTLENSDITIKMIQYFYIVKLSFLLHSMNNLVNFMRYLTSINIVWLD
jgi:hypothetical protein